MVIGRFATTRLDGNNGFFRIRIPDELLPAKSERLTFAVVAHDGVHSVQTGWEHVSVSTEKRCPTWDEMHAIKRLFWNDDETVVQLHVPEAVKIDNHPYVLHMWRKIGGEAELPPPNLVGLQTPNKVVPE